MTEELKPCPHCGGQPVLERKAINEPYFSGYIFCPACMIGQLNWLTDEHVAIGTWNKRNG